MPGHHSQKARAGEVLTRMSQRSIAATKTGQQRLGNRNRIRPCEFLDCDYEDAAENRAQLGTATDMDRGWLVAQTGPDASGFRQMVFGKWADCQSATQQTTSLRYGGSAKMRPRKSAQCEQTLTEPDTDPRPRTK